MTGPEGSHFPYDLPVTSNCGSEHVSVCTFADMFVRVGNWGCVLRVHGGVLAVS